MQWKNKGVLVTGGAGLIGSHLVDALIERGAKVTILDNLEPQTHPHGAPEWIPARAKFIEGDCRNSADWEKALQGVEYVFHQAAFGGFTPELSKYMDANATGTARLFEVIAEKKFPVKKIVAASSQAVYGEGAYACEEHGTQYPAELRPVAQLQQGRWEAECPACRSPMKPLLNPETKPLFTETIYGISKLAQERLVLGMGRKLGIPSVALRYAVTYGPRQSLFNPYTGVVSIFSTQILNGKSPIVYEDGNQTRDYLYVGDNVLANLFVMENDKADGQVFNVGTGIPTSVNQLVSHLVQAYGKKDIGAHHPNEFRPGDVRHFVHDAGKLQRLGWRPQTSLREGLQHYAGWIMTQGNVAEYFSAAREKMRAAGIVHVK